MSSSLPKTKKVIISTPKGAREIVISKMPLGKYAQVMEKLKVIPRSILSIVDMESDQIIVNLPNLMAECWSDIVETLSIASGLPVEVLENEVGMEEAVDIVIAVIEVNGFFNIAQKGQALWAKIGSR
ncbi:MAG: hypothetical protein ACOY9Y_09720 [Bacillota bacterium]